MNKLDFNPALIRAIVIIVFFALSTILRARKSSKLPRPTVNPGTAKPAPLDIFREAIQRASAEARARQGKPPISADSTPEPTPFTSDFTPTAQLLPRDAPFEQPPAIQPESGWLPSLLLLALLVCLCLMAYRYFAG